MIKKEFRDNLACSKCKGSVELITQARQRERRELLPTACHWCGFREK